MDTYLTTERLRLRPLTPDDLDDLLRLDSDPDVLRWTNPKGSCASRAEYETCILPQFLAWYAHSDGFGYWAAVEKATGAFLGWFHFRPARDSPNDIELGYRLLPEGQNKGYATEGARALIAKGFTNLGVERVVATTLEDNARSRRVLEKVGLRLVESFIYPGLDMRGVKYALDRADWVREGSPAGDR